MRTQGWNTQYAGGNTQYDKNGVTLIELVMVIVMISILAVLAIPRFESFYYIKLQGAAKRVISDIRYTQQMALARHEKYKIVFSTGTDSYEVRRVSDNSYATDPFTRANLNVSLSSDAQFQGIDIAATNLTSGTLQFNWQGVPLDVTDSALSADASVRLDYKGYSVTVYITPDTGRTRVQ
jgi:prepilin-type N-terminal cleavage/methylation domain-containing protein